MNEFLSVFVITYELCLENLLVLIVALLIPLSVFLITLGKNKERKWKQVLPEVVKLLLLISVPVFFLLPVYFQSSVTELKYLPDWLMNAGMTLGMSGYFALVAWPLLAVRRVD